MKKTHLLYSLFVILVIHHLSLHKSYAQRYNFKTYNVEDGLAQSQVYSTCQDKEGNLWFGTFRGGVCKYNGVEFKTFTTKDGLGDNGIYCLFADSRGDIWIGTHAGLSKYISPKPLSASSEIKNSNQGRFINYSRRQGMKCRRITSIYEDQNGNIWVGGYGGLSIIEPLKVKESENSTYDSKNEKMFFNHYGINEGLSDSIVTAITGDNYGDIYIATYDEHSTLSFLHNKANNLDISSVLINKIKTKDGLISDYIYEMRKDNFGQIWLLTEKGLSKLYPGESKKSKNFQFSNYSWEIPDFFSSKKNIPRAFLLDNRGDFWFATDGNGLFRMSVDELNSTLKTVDHFTEKNGLPTNFLWSIIQDFEENLWIGTDGGGVTRFRGKMFETFSKEDGLSDNDVFSVTQTKDGKFWIGFYTGGVNIYDPSAEPTKRFSVFQFPKALDMTGVQGITQDLEGNMWFAGDMGTVQYNPVFGSGDKAYRLFTTPDTIAVYKHTNKIIEDKKKNIWISTMYRGLQKLTPDPASPLGYTRKFFTYRDGMVKAYVKDFIIDHQGDIWVGSTKGLSHLIFKSDTSKPEVHKITKETGLPFEYILTVFEDRKNNIWLGTAEGAIKIVRNPDELKPGENAKYIFRKFSTTEGMSSDLIYLINEDTEGNLWFGTNKGVDQYLVDRGTFRNYGKAEGFTGIETNLKATCKDNKGNLWFGTIKGLVKYNASEAFRNTIEPITSITRLQIYFKDVEIPANHVFSFEQNYLTFDFNAVCMTNPLKVYYQWKLDGFDKDWLPVSKTTQCTYSNLSHGEYTFMVKACNNEGIWNEKPAQFSFTIKPPFWKTWWFYLLTIITGLGLIFWFIRFRTQKLEKAKRILEVKVKIRTEELSIQKKMVEEKNKNIIDSIEYAQKIQQAMLPEADGLKNILHESFILYQPKDIVSGDFYWFAKLPNGLTFFAVADCTGHGVPGALMSVLGCELLNQIVYEKKIYSPAKILSELNQRVKTALKEDELKSTAREGMDIALCAYEPEIKTLKFSSANLTLYCHYSNGMVEHKTDKEAIGGFTPNDYLFSETEVSLNNCKSFFLSTDGYADQFGGPKNKKYSKAVFREFLTGLSDLSMEEQKRELARNHSDWKKENEQTDDILVIGFRV